MGLYGRRLARIHARDYTMYARAAAALLSEEPKGTVIDVGCGGGDVLEGLEGWTYLGVDISADMIALARERYPQAQFLQADARDLPDVPTSAVLAIGEVVNYAMDLPGLIEWVHKVRGRLNPGGVLILDVAGPTRAEPEPRTQVHVADDYRLEVTVFTDAARTTLTRTIVVRDAQGSDTETHTLHLMDPVDVMAALRAAGFEVTPLDRYADDLPFPRGWSGFLARVILDS